MQGFRFSRRTFLLDAGLALPSSYLAWRGWPLLGQAPTPVPQRLAESRATAAKAKITTVPLRGGVSVLMNAGGNIAVLPGKDGKVLVDSGYATAQPQTVEALAAISGDPLTHLINTHWHYDHVDGNEWMHASGATVIAHKKTLERMSTQQTIAAFGMTLPPSPAGALPTRTFTGKHTLKLNGATLELAHYEPAHTDTDISVLFTEANVLHCGDTWFNGFYPFIDISSGGNINGMIAAAERNLGAANAETIIIPGHGKVGNKAQLAEFHTMLSGVRDAVAAEKKQGKSLEETIAAMPTAAFDAQWGRGFLTPAQFVGFVYPGV